MRDIESKRFLEITKEEENKVLDRYLIIRDCFVA